MSDEVKATLATIIERWGFPVLVAVACGWMLRQDVLLPLVQAHTKFLEQLGDTQKDISKALGEQTRLLYALQPRSGESGYVSSATSTDAETKN
jgi:hypothetical protein